MAGFFAGQLFDGLQVQLAAAQDRQLGDLKKTLRVGDPEGGWGGQAFLANVRFDVPPNHPVDQGLSLAALELKRPDALALRLMAHLPNRLLQWVHVGHACAKQTRKLLQTASGLCLGIATDQRPQTDFAVGRAMQRAWLALTEHQMAVQPMMSLAVLENALRHGSPPEIKSWGEDRIRSLSQAWQRAVPEIGQGRTAFLLRFGMAAPPSGRTGRLPLPAVISGTEN